MLSNIFKNWKTTSAGIIMIVGAIALYVSDNTKLVEALTALLFGIGMIVAKDADQTGLSE